MKKNCFIIIVLLLMSSAVFSQEKKYDIEEGIIYGETTTLGMNYETVTYFKDFGRMQTVETNAEMFGQTIKSRFVMTTDYIYMLDMNEKTGTKSKITDYSDDAIDIDYNNTSLEYQKEHQIKDLGEEVVAGKKCNKISVVLNGAETKLSIWKNIPLKSETKQGGLEVIMITTKVIENPTFPKGIFDIPEDFKITEMSLE